MTILMQEMPMLSLTLFNKGFRSALYNTDVTNAPLDKFKSLELNVLVTCTALNEGFDMPQEWKPLILSAFQ